MQTFLIILGVVLLLAIVQVIILRSYGWGPFKKNFWIKEVKRVRGQYDLSNHQNGIVFYGASNFRLWKTMETDLKKYTNLPVTNSGIGGSTDMILVEYFNDLVIPYNPKVLFFQTGSNEYINMTGTDEEKANKVMEYKIFMYNKFHAALPNTKFVVVSGLLLPGRDKFKNMTMLINKKIKAYCDTTDYITFINCESLTYSNGSYKEELFIKDKIHLNEKGQHIWMDNYLSNVIEDIK